MGNHHTEAGQPTNIGSRPLKIAQAIVLVVMVAEVIGGILSGFYVSIKFGKLPFIVIR